jgi:hypothetical protein
MLELMFQPFGRFELVQSHQLVLAAIVVKRVGVGGVGETFITSAWRGRCAIECVCDTIA